MTTVADLEEALETIINGAGTKADKARALYALDPSISRTDVVELLGMSYSQAHSIWKALGNESSPQPTGGGSKFSKAVEAEARRQNNLRLSPTQTRYITQDGHIIVRVDAKEGPICRQCQAGLTFSLQYLGFVHAYSAAEPDNIEDRYDMR